MSTPRILVIDNRDSFTENVVHALREAGAATGVVDSRQITAHQVARMALDGLVISPGPGRPADFDVAATVQASIDLGLPVFGVCLGLQGIVEHQGGTLDQLDIPMHGKPSEVKASSQRSEEGEMSEKV